jgi:hypothetical protein
MSVELLKDNHMKDYEKSPIYQLLKFLNTRILNEEVIKQYFIFSIFKSFVI